MNAVIEDYNNLPHGKANRVEVRQMAVTEQVYAQFLNVHLISGTAPDIVAKGMSRLLGSGTSLTRYFEPVSGYVSEPNPYNQEEYLPDGIRPELENFLRNASWNETFTDGMLGGWEDSAQDYFAVPVSSWGAMRTFVNLDLSKKVKELLRESWVLDPQP